LKLRGFYLEVSKTGQVLAPTDFSNEETLRDVISHVHQIGWQLRLGEHIEGRRQDEQAAGHPPVTDDADTGLLDRTADRADDPEVARILREVREPMREGIPGIPLNNSAYRFNPLGEVNCSSADMPMLHSGWPLTISRLRHAGLRGGDPRAAPSSGRVGPSDG
jgi:hypothetical protein